MRGNRRGDNNGLNIRIVEHLRPVRNRFNTRIILLNMLAFGCVLLSHHHNTTVLKLDEIPQEIWTPIAISDHAYM